MNTKAVVMNTKAVVKIQVEVSLYDTWGQDCKIEQVFNQARVSAINRVSKLLSTDTNIRIIGDPRVDTIISSND